MTDRADASVHSERLLDGTHGDETQFERSLHSHAALANICISRANCVTAQNRNDLTPAAPAATPAQVRMRAITPAN
jgi:hypothetical protein